MANDGEPTADNGPDRFELMADEIAGVLRTAHESAQRMQDEAEQEASARIGAASEQAAALVAGAEAEAEAKRDAAEVAASARHDEAEAAAVTKRDEAEAAAVTRRDEAEAAASARLAEAELQSAKLVEDAKGLLQDATSLLEEAQERDRTVRREADAYAEARKNEHVELIAEAVRDRDQSADLLARSRQLLADAERVLERSVEQATSSLSALSEIQGAVAVVHGEHGALPPLPTPPPADSPGATPGEASAGEVEDDGVVIDLTDSDTASEATVDADAKGAEQSGDAPSTDQLGRALRDAVSRAVEQTSRSQDPET